MVSRVSRVSLVSRVSRIRRIRPYVLRVGVHEGSELVQTRFFQRIRRQRGDGVPS
jgi:hypothetical protein